MTAIPTTYAGVRFRSRLEARWAAFFDLLEWRWEYEPIDLDGYIPDFLVECRRWHGDPSKAESIQDVGSLLIEVKPVTDWRGQDVEDALDVIRRSGWDREAVLVGAIWDEDLADGFARIGQFALDHSFPAEEQHGFGPSVVLMRCDVCTRPSVLSECGSWFCRRCGAYCGGTWHGEMPDAVALWREAGNRVQWRSPR